MAGTTGGSPWLKALAATMLIQTCSSFLTRLAPTLAPPLVARSAIDEAAIGYFSAVGTLGSILFMFAGTPILLRFGAIRSLQIGIVLAGVGAALLLLPGWWALALSTLLIGVGYGPSAPAGSDVLQRYSPPNRRNLLFSIKQAGVPIGGVAAGLLLPLIYEQGGFAGVVAAAMALVALTALFVQPMRTEIDQARNPEQRIGLATIFSLQNFLRPLVAIASLPDLRRLGLSGAFFAVGQGCWFSFFVTFLVQDIRLSLAAAGAAFAVMQAASIVGRIGLGWLADQLGSGLPVLRVVALASAICTGTLALATPDWRYWQILLLALLAGVTVSAWNGVQIAEMARRAPKGRVGESASGATILVFIGYVLGPAGIALALQATGSFPLCLAAVAVLTALAVPLLGQGAKPGERD